MKTTDLINREISMRDYAFSPKPLKWQFYWKDLNDSSRGVYSEAGVYILKDEDKKPIYIGQTNNLLNRIRTHKGLSGQFRGMFFYVDLIYLSEIKKHVPDICNDYSDSVVMRVIESKLIEELNPEFNRQRHSVESIIRVANENILKYGRA